jgi:hypothetical protein
MPGVIPKSLSTALALLLLGSISGQSITDIRPGTYLARTYSPKVLDCTILIDSNRVFKSEHTYWGEGIVSKFGLKGRITSNENNFVVQIDSTLREQPIDSQKTIDMVVRNSRIKSTSYQYYPTNRDDVELNYRVVKDTPIIDFMNRSYVWIRCPHVAFNCSLMYKRAELDSIWTELSLKE